MTYGRSNAPAVNVHFSVTAHRPRETAALCGTSLWNATYATGRVRVTCKRCLASLAKRDREFQRKARTTFTRRLDAPLMRQRYGVQVGLDIGYTGAFLARAAIAREEGREVLS